MTLLTLYGGEKALLASGRRVFSPEEIGALDGALETAERLDALLRAEQGRVADACAEGTRRGREAGQADGERVAADAQARALLAMQRLHEDDVARQAEEGVALALEIVRRIAGEVAPAHWLAAQARRAAEELVERSPLTLRVHPERVAAVRATLAEREPANETAPFDEVLGDESLGYDDCVLDSRFGRVDASLETQLERIAELDIATAAPGAAPGTA